MEESAAREEALAISLEYEAASATFPRRLSKMEVRKRTYPWEGLKPSQGFWLETLPEN